MSFSVMTNVSLGCVGDQNSYLVFIDRKSLYTSTVVKSHLSIFARQSTSSLRRSPTSSIILITMKRRRSSCRSDPSYVELVLPVEAVSFLGGGDDVDVTGCLSQ